MIGPVTTSSDARSSWVLTAMGDARSDFLGFIHVCHERLCRHDSYTLEIVLDNKATRMQGKADS
jgi:hypothetical protein